MADIVRDVFPYLRMFGCYIQTDILPGFLVAEKRWYRRTEYKGERCWKVYCLNTMDRPEIFGCRM